VVIKNSDGLCLLRATGLGIDYCQQLENPTCPVARRNYRTNRRGDSDRCTRQRQIAHGLREAAGLSEHVGYYGIEQIKILQEHLDSDGYQLYIFDVAKFKAVVFPPSNVGRDVPTEKRIYLELKNYHFNFIR